MRCEKCRELGELIDAEKDEIIAEGRRHKAIHDDSVRCIREAVGLLKNARLSQQLDVEQLCKQSGLDENTVMQLETDPEPHTPISTLVRYARCLGKRIEITIRNSD